MDLQNTIKSGLTHELYLNLTEKLVAQGKTSGAIQNEELVNYTKLNLQRMLRVGKTMQILPELHHTLKKIERKQIWVVLTETWCGDAAQSLPALHQIANSNPNIEFRILLRDEHPELMDRYLTNGAKSIPKLIGFDMDLNELFVWGPRPKAAQNLALELIKQGASKEEKGLAIQKWYNSDKTISLQKEINTLLEKLT